MYDFSQQSFKSLTHKMKGLEGLLEKLKKQKKRSAATPAPTIRPRIKYMYTDYIHPSYFKDVAEPEPEIVCGYCKKPQGSAKFDFCSACKKVYYCSKDCQVKDWKTGHKAQCAALKAGKA